MNSLAKRESLPAVTAAGGVAILFSLFGVLISLLVVMLFLFAPETRTRAGVPSAPDATRAMTEVMMVFLLALSVFGVFVGIGVLRRRNWARIAILIWAVVMAFASICAIAFVLFVFTTLPMQTPNVPDAAVVLKLMRFFVVLFYGIPAGVGLWWIILFTRKRVAAAFTNQVEQTPATDPSGFPHSESAIEPLAKPKPACPLPLAILAGWFIFSGFSSLLFAFAPLPFTFPLYLFGHVYFGIGPKIFLSSMALILGISGVGMFKLKPWALHAILAIQSLFFVNGLFAIVSPTFRTEAREAMEKMSTQYSGFPSNNPLLTDTTLQSGMIFGLVFGAIIIGLLLFLRSRFLEQAAAAAAAKT